MSPWMALLHLKPVRRQPGKKRNITGACLQTEERASKVYTRREVYYV